ncbi:MAG: glycosyltransferase [Lachnospiraceae bacterium]|nr:glycosyltransferase [Lachnospiraceae bacterium]
MACQEKEIIQNCEVVMEYKVSIIIPVYNGVGKLDKCVKSIARQTMDSVEVIFINDGSKDDSLNYLQKLIKRYHNKNYSYRIINQKNKGIANTRNKGIEEANGEFIMFSDQDDFFTDTYIEALYDEITDEENDVVYGGYERVKIENGKIKVITRVVSEGKLFDKYQIIAPWTHIYRRDFIIRNNIRFLDSKIGEDLFFNVTAYSKTAKISSITNTDYKWYYNDESVSNNLHTVISEESDPSFLLNKLINNITNDTFLKNPLTEYFFLRFVCWYLLYTFRGSNKEDIKKMYKGLFKFMELHFPNYKKNKYLYGNMPGGEDLKIYLIMNAFMVMHNVGIMQPALSILSKYV